MSRNPERETIVRWRTATRVGAVVAACALIASCSPARVRKPAIEPPTARPGSPEPAPAGDLIETVLDAHNAARARRRLPPLSLATELSQAAQVQADDMARRGKMSHRGSDGSSPFERMRRAGYSYTSAAENVAFGFNRVDAVMDGWMHSPGHRRNILGPYREMGVGHATAATGASFWCVTFGVPAAADFPPPRVR